MLRHGISPHFCLRKNVFVEIEIEWSEVEKIEMVFVEWFDERNAILPKLKTLPAAFSWSNIWLIFQLKVEVCSHFVFLSKFVERSSFKISKRHFHKKHITNINKFCPGIMAASIQVKLSNKY